MKALLEKETSPMMIQWHTCKKEAGNALLLFRLGDFYEAFYEDAERLSQELHLTLTKRQEIPMAGIPFHSSETYIDKLLAKGYRVAIAEQMEDPKAAKGLVKREIVRILTPGTVIHSSLLQAKTSNYIACVTAIKNTLGMSILELSTGECRIEEFACFSALQDELARLCPKELLLSNRCLTLYKEGWEIVQGDLSCCLQTRDDTLFHLDSAYTFLCEHFGVHTLDGLGLQNKDSAILALGALLSYVQEELHLSIASIQEVKQESSSSFMTLDGATLRHLEILENMQDKDSKYSLLHHIDKTHTPMGGRLLRYWISHPLLSLQALEQRQDAVETLVEKSDLGNWKMILSGIKDLERLTLRIETNLAGPRDIHALALSLQKVPAIIEALQDTSSSLLQSLRELLPDMTALTTRITDTLVEDPPMRLNDGLVIRPGISQDLDQLRALSIDSESWIATYQQKLREETGAKTLKVGYTKAFGYYIEVSRAQAEKVPSSFEKRQTLVNNERFVTAALKEYEHQVLSAEERKAALEAQLFAELRTEVAVEGQAIRKLAHALAQIDCLVCLAIVAQTHGYIRPKMVDSAIFHIEGGRHPVIEASMRGTTFIPNDTFLNDQDHRLLVLTGPNMAGKSTYIRQVALLAILAQIGSFIPATRATLGLMDKVLTRIGASDNLSRGQSTFMVEMAETAHILRNATDRSLVILDEIGRGTSTYDGISLAWAIAEYLLTVEGKQAKTLFATHYCELLALEDNIPGAINYHVAVDESAKGIIFLHKIQRGGTDKSYGIHVARLAGLPLSVLKKASKLLKDFSKQSHKPKVQDVQLTFFDPPPEHPLLQELRDLEPEYLSPMEALQKLFAWKRNLAL